MFIFCAADIEIHFANTTKFHFKKRLILQAGVIGRRLDEIKRQFGITTPRLCRPPSRRWRGLHQYAVDGVFGDYSTAQSMDESASGTFRTSRDVRLESVIRTKADIVYSKLLPALRRCRRRRVIIQSKPTSS